MPGKYHIKTELDRAIHVMELLTDKDNFRNLSERVAFMHYLAKMLRRVSALLAEHRNNVCTSIVDDSGIDYMAMKGSFQKCANDFENVSDGGYLRTYDEEYLENPDDFVREFKVEEVLHNDEHDFNENTFFKNPQLESAHKVLLGNSVNIYKRITKELEVIIGMLNAISLYERELPSSLSAIYDSLYLDYEKHEWRSKKETFKRNLLYQIQGFDSTLERLNRYYPIYINEFSSSEYGCANTQNPYKYIYQHRRELSKDNLHDIFYRLHCKRKLEDCIAYFDLVNEPEHKLIFKNKAAEELITLLMPIITSYKGFEYSYQYVVVLMVCDDLKLTQTDNSRRGADYVAFMNPLLKEKYWASDSSTYNPYLRKLTQL